MSTALIDADIVNFQSAAAAQRDYGDEMWVDASKALADAVDQIDEQVEAAECTDIILCYSPKNGTNFRKKLFTEYKANRKKKPKPVCYYDLRDELEKRYTHKSIDWLEADDLMGLLSGKIEDSVIISIDKDMECVPATIMNPMKHVWPVEITEHKANYNHLYQTIIGDTTDNYKGIKGVGPKGAQALLSEFYSLKIDDDGTHIDNFDLEGAVKAVKNLYTMKGQDDFLQQARVARILRPGEFDFKTNEIKLWNPDGDYDTLKV